MSDGRLRILHFLDDCRLEAGGVTRAVLDLCTHLAARGHGVTLATQEDKDVPASWRAQAPGVPRAVRLQRPSRSGVEALVQGADVVHLHAMWTPGNIPFASEARRRRVPYVFSPHGMLDDWSMGQRRLKKRVFLALVGRRMLEGAACVHCTAQAELEQARKWFPRGRGRAVPLILDLAPYVSPPGPERAQARFPRLKCGRPTILFLSRLHPKKGLETLVRVGAALRDQALDASILIAGTGEAEYEARVRALAAELRLEDRVEFLGMVTGEDKVSLYQAADVFMLPTSQENFGFVFFESLAAGTPVVTTRGVDTWAELEASGGAVITDGSVGVMAAAAADLLRDAEKRRSMGARGRAWALETLEPGRTIGLYEAMYRGEGG